MKQRIKNKLQKKHETKALNIADAIGSKPTTCIVKANKQQLENIGCDADLMECEVEYIKDYPTGYSQVKTERKDISEVLGKPIFEFYDIPKIWLEFK
jgi:hypothetical protein